MSEEKNEYTERLKKYIKGKRKVEVKNRQNENDILDKLIKNSELDITTIENSDFEDR